MSERKGPLSGYRILEVGHILAGPYATMLLADLGAEVIKIETGEGDIARSVGATGADGHNLYFTSLNRNKKSVLLDLTDPGDAARFHALVATSHGLVTNLRPSAIRKLGLTYDALRSHNPALVCVAVTGFGLSGPYSDYPAYDYIVQAMTGVAYLTGDPDGPPVRVGYSVADNSAGMMGALGLLAKMLEGKGGQIEVSLYDTMLSQLNYLASACLNAGTAPERHAGGGHAYFVPAQFFETKDGHIALFITHDKFWRAFASELGREDWLTDARFAAMDARHANRDLVVASVSEELGRCATADWLARLRPLGLVVSDVRTLPDALGDDHTAARGMIAEIATPEGALRIIAAPIKDAESAERYEPPPRLGEHTAVYCP